jgi:hypothetical protein
LTTLAPAARRRYRAGVRKWVLLAFLAACGDAVSAPPGDTTTTGETTTPTTGDTSTTGPLPDPGSSSGEIDTTAAAESSSTGEPASQPGSDEVVELFVQEHVYFGDEDRRQIDVQIELPPPDLTYESVQLGIVLGCPNDLCDWWDRVGFIGVVHDAGTDTESVTEVARFVTPYRVGATWILDVGHLRPVLSGSQTIRVFIDTWVGPGHANGEGWLVDASLQFLGGVPEHVPIEVIDLWPTATSIPYGNPEQPIEATAAPVTVDIPADATHVELRSIITGHGQGNADNCAEFCPRTHGFDVGGTIVSRQVWRDDCDQTPVQGQQGTWTLPRAGWCPGAEVLPWVEDVTAAVTPGGSITIAYDIEPYTNTCSPRSPECMGCTLGTGCEYDGGSHTPPTYRFGAQLVVSRDP